MDLSTLRAEDFTGRVNETFTLSGPAGPLVLVLKHVHHLGAAAGQRAFALDFLGPAQPILPQAIYSMENPALGVLNLFIVPLGPRDGGMGYEAIFG